MFIKIIIFLIILIIEIYSKKYTLIKNPKENNEYSPYIFNFTLYNDLVVYPSIFDTSSLYIVVYNENEIINDSQTKNLYDKEIIINNKTFKYKVAENELSKYYKGIIGLSNKVKYEGKNSYDFSRNDRFDEFEYNIYSYLRMLEKEDENIEKYINFIQNDEYQAEMIFGEIDSRFKNNKWSKCKCSEIYWGCQISSIKIGGNELYTPTSNSKEFGIISISDEYIIVPKEPGDKIITKYKKKIKDIFDIKCNITTEKDYLVHLTCDYFNYEYLPDLSFIMEGGVGIMAISVDLFKIVENHTLELKIKYYDNEKKGNNKWYLGEPVVKNYNFILNYTDKDDVYLIIIPASLNGFILIIVACVGGFFFLFIFITCIYCISNKNKSKRYRRKLSGNLDYNLWKNPNNSKDYLYNEINSINIKIQEDEDEEEKSEEDEKKEDNNDDNHIDNNNLNQNDNNNKNENEEDIKIGNGCINDSYIETSSLINNNNNNIDDNPNNGRPLRINSYKSNNNIDNIDNINVELSKYENDEDDDRKELYKKQKKPKNE